MNHPAYYWFNLLNEKWTAAGDFDPNNYETLFEGESLTPNFSRAIL